jgi:flagellar hook assembly protein FlgD
MPPVSWIMLTPNYPNPFSAGTTFDLDLPTDAEVAVDVLDVAGRRVRQLALGRMSAGSRSMSFDGRDATGRRLPSGLYFCRVIANGAMVTNKMVITHP